MEENKPYLKRLTIGVIIFVSLIIIGLITLRRPDFEYQLNETIALQTVMDISNEVSPATVKTVIDDENSGYVFIDLRNPYDFNIGSIKNAINIQVSELLSPSSLEQFRKWKEEAAVVVFYGKTQTEANGPWMLMTQLGFTNTRILAGGYDYYSYDAKPGDTTVMNYAMEKPMVDFSELIKGITQETVAGPETEKTVQKRPEVVIPKKQPQKAAEQEGC